MQRQEDKLEKQLELNFKRAYLDAESSDDNDERQYERNNYKVVKKEAASPPAYHPEELEKLIRCIKMMTTLPGLNDNYWCQAVLNNIKEFFLKPDQLILSIYYRDNVLTSELNFPSTPIHELTYFVRMPGETFNIKNFHSKIIFGTINENVETTILNLMNNILAPIFFKMTTWPDSVKSDLCTALHDCLCSITDLNYKMHGLTVMYLPREAMNFSITEDANNELLKRLKRVVFYWSKQIKLALADTQQTTTYDLLCHADEYHFWVNRWKNLCGLRHQIKSSHVQHIVNVLQQNQSTHIQRFLLLNEEIDKYTNEAMSNIEFLDLLRQPCDDLNDIEIPESMSEHLPTILHLFRFIWLHSSFYNTDERAHHLIQLINNQIIIICRNFINLDDILMQGKTRWGIAMLKRCIAACENYKQLYFKFANAHNTLTSHPWNLNIENVFRYINSFIRRCRDLIEICCAMIDFARLDETIEIPHPRFGGTKSLIHEGVCQKVEKLFLEHLHTMKLKAIKILDVREATWHDDMFAFRTKMKDLEIIIENLMNAVFKNMNNVHQGIANLYGFHIYMNRESLETLFDSMRSHIWRLFANEIHNTKQKVLEERKYPSSTPYFSGRALCSNLKKKQLEMVKHQLTEAKWMGQSEISEEIFHQYDIMVNSIRETTAKLYQKWITDIGDNPKSRLDRYLMRRSNDKPELLESNLDSYVLNLCHEARHWQYLGFQIPVHIAIVNDNWQTLQFVSESVFMLVLTHNRIINAFSHEEKSLFKQLIGILDQKIQPGLTKLTWNTEFIDSYVEDCCDHVASLENFLDIYKRSNIEIRKHCKDICNTPLIKIKPNHRYELSELENELKIVRTSAFEIITDAYKSILKYLIVIYEGVQTVMAQSSTEWGNYLHNLNKLLEEALKLCTKNSMNIMYTALHGDETTGPLPLIMVEADLIDNKIDFIPPQTEITRVIGNVLENLLEPLKSMKRITETFGITKKVENSYLWRTFKSAKSFMQLQKMLDDEVTHCFNQLQTYLKSWEPFNDTWEINKDMFIKRYENLKPTVTLFDADIERYVEVANNVHMQETVTTVHFLDVNSDRLKASIVEHCALWQQKLIALLSRITQTSIDKLYKYMDENGKKISKEPRDLIAMQAMLRLFERLRAEIPREKEEFPKIREQYQTLKKYEAPMTLQFKRKIKELDRTWEKYIDLFAKSKIMIETSKEQFKYKLMEQVVVLEEDIAALMNKFYDSGPFTSDWESSDALRWLTKFREEMQALRKTELQLKNNLFIFEITQSDSIELSKIDKDLVAIELVWQLTNEWNETWEHYKTETFWKIDIEIMDSKANQLLKKLTRLSKELKTKDWSIVDYSRSRVDQFRRTLPLITDLKNPAMRERHWIKIKTIVDNDFDEKSNDFTLDAIAKMQMQKFAEQINDISNAASMELTIETGLNNIAATWKNMQLEMTSYKETGIFRLQSVDEIFQILEDHQVQLSAMKSTRFVEPFIKEADQWGRSLFMVGEVLEASLLFQRGYMYLDNIFHAEDIRIQLPKETDHFDELTIEWINISSTMAKAKNILGACEDPPNLLQCLNKLNNDIESIQCALGQYLETKRYTFPRFYFISNDDLLEILANSKRPDLIQPHIKKLFSNKKSLMISKLANKKYIAEGMLSSENEYVEYLSPVLLEGQVELWLCKIERAMRDCLREVLQHCRAALRKMSSKRDKWVMEWPSQPGITSTQIQWTRDCTRALRHCKLIDSRKPMKKLHKRQNQVLEKYSEAVRRSDINKLERIKLKAIVVIEIHARDVIEKIYKLKCDDITAFEWISQLRFYWDRDIDDCIIRQTNTHFIYGYEYLGNSERLVITPLTDRCYITLTTAIHLYRGGSPKGPAGTGKTETVKDLSKALGFNVIVQNCSEGLDYKSMGKLFSGLAQTGAWGCFDEFNRINIEVLSVVAQQISSILTALSHNLSEFVFEGCNISLVNTCGIFITMNPGYAGRTELPDNLKSMFRPISMMVPDSSMIAEISLFGEGFENTRTLAKKIHTLYSLAQQQLSKQHHYDFGLRGIVMLTRYAGKRRRQYANLLDEEIILLAMKDMNKAKLTTDDLPLFNGITSDLFPGIGIPSVDYDEFIEYITREALKLNLQPVQMLLTKVIELYETKNSRHSTMIVGQSNTGKSSTWKLLKNTMMTMKQDSKTGFNLVYEYPINPKALNLGELYGEYNLSTGEWSDGVISSIMRKTCADDSSDEKWILFDGPVDALWIENMNSVMDDNKILTLINNERITMPEQVSLLFEVEDLAVASPATVSRAGMIYNDYKDLGWRPSVNSWLQKHNDKQEFIEEMEPLFNRYVDKILIFKRQQCIELIPVPELNSVESLCKLLEVLATKKNGVDFNGERDVFNLMCKLWFLFCMIWSLCASVNEEGRQKMDNYVREMESAFPFKDTVYEYYVDVRQRSFVSWEEKLSLTWKYALGSPFYKIIVPTVDTIRYNYLTSELLASGYPVLLVGPVGTGKSSIAQSVLESLDKTKYNILTINVSGQTTSNNVQETIESKVEKRMKEIYVPIGGKTMITFMDDFNMPMKDTYGSQPPLELIRQWIDYKFWYHRQKQKRKYIQKMQLMSAMGPPGGGRNTITNRLLTKFNIINMTFPVEKQIARIYGTMLNQQLFNFDNEVRGIANEITLSTIEMYNNIVTKMLPTPGKIHYLFNLRDISKIFQGLLRSHKDYQYSRQTFLRLWIHEIFRVFGDRLIDERDHNWFIAQINEQLGKYFELTFHNLCPEKRSPIFGSFMNAWGIYEDMTDLVALRRYIETQIDEYNTSPNIVRLNLVLFRDAVEHICRIIRIISQSRGHVLLVGIGGSGRQCLSKISSYMSELSLFQIQMTKHYDVLEFREDLKRLYLMAGVDNKPTCFLFNDTQIVEEQFLEIINNMLGTGEVANLYKPDEIEEIKKCLTKEAMKAKIIPTSEAIYSFLIERVKTNMHMIICMNPIGDNFRNRLRNYPGLINYTTIDWFLTWPHDALLEVGNKFLMDLDFVTATISDINEEESIKVVPSAKSVILLQERMVDDVAIIFALIHETVVQYSKRMAVEMKRYYYVTPTNFLELVAGYKNLLEYKRQETTKQANKLRSGLWKLDDTRDKVNKMTEELENTQKQVLTSTKDCEEYLLTIINQRRDADETEKFVTTKSIRIEMESKECKKLEEVARADLATVEPSLKESLKALDALNKRDLSEIKSFTRPPPKVEMVMEAVMILKNSAPTWSESKRQLGDVNFLSSLHAFDKDHISDRILKSIKKYTSNSEFDPEKVGQVSIAAKSLCMWVIAMENYGKLYRIVAPKRERLQLALESLELKEKELNEAIAQLQKLRHELKNLQEMYDAKMKEKEDLIKMAELLKMKLERAAMLVDGLSGEHERWQMSVKSLGEFYDRLPGDCLISTGFISYLGPFVSTYREELVTIWMNEVKEKKIPHTINLNVKEFLSNPTTIREWNIQGLPTDGFSTENGIIITRGTRWPLVIDPQCQAIKWIKNMEANNKLQVIDFGRHDFTAILEKALQFGEPVLLENIGEDLDPALNPILQRAFIKLGDTVIIKFNDKSISYNNNFRLYLTTKLSNPHYSPEISTKTTLCNFAIKEEGLEAQLLGIVVRKEKPQLEQQKDDLVQTIASGKRMLIDLEDKILHLLSITSGSLLDDLDLLNTLQTAKTTSTSVQESLVITEKTEIEIDQAREEYRPCSKRAAILFFVLNDMSHIDPMYQFALDSYINLFMLSIDKSPKKSKLNERIESLNDFHTYAIYKNTCRGLFENHKLLFSFHMCVKILEAQGEIVPMEYDFLLKGGIVLDRENQPDKPVTWLLDETWDNVTELDKLPGFHGIVSSYEQIPRDWHNWYINADPETKSLPGNWEKDLTDFQKILVMRSCRSDRMSFCIATFITQNLESRFVEPPVLDVKSVLEDSLPHLPLIFILSSGVDPSGVLMQLAEDQGMSQKFMTLSLGQGQAPIATKMIESGTKEGLWIFLANCHLSLSWMSELDKIVGNFNNRKKNLHPDFRLWLSSSPTPQFPISILQAGIKMTTEPPKGLKANMKRLYGLITEEKFDICRSKEKYKKLLFSLVFFHSILLERKKFQHLGWNIIYSFNDSDFEISENLLQIYLDEYTEETPWNALTYLIAGVCYGGHVTDDWDRRLLMTYVQQYFNDNALTETFYRLSPLPTYYMPRDGSLESYRDFITMLPSTDKPEAFGQHMNADITSLIVESRTMFEMLMSLRIQISYSDEGEINKEAKVMQLAAEIQTILPNNIDYETAERLIGSIKKPLDVVLLQEIIRYNALLNETRNSLYDLQCGVKGLIVMSEKLEDMFTCVHEGRVPFSWLTAYPSLKPLGSWTRDLISRVEHFAKWAKTTHQPLLFWLAAFTFPTGFLTAVLQTSARLWNISIDLLSWEFTVLDETKTILDAPTDGVYVRGIFLEGAGWDQVVGTLIEPAPMQLVCDMPIIHFRPMEHSRKKYKELYHSPCYYYPIRGGNQKHSAFVVAVDLKTVYENPDFWIKRGTALLLSLAT